MLDALTKLLEQLLVKRLRSHLVVKNSLANNQYGFSVVKAANGRGYLHNLVMGMLTLHVTNAFIMTPWDAILSATRRMSVTDYLINLLGSYLHTRETVYNTAYDEWKTDS